VQDKAGKQQSPAAHANARFTARAANCPSMAANWEDPAGVPIDAILFGGRRPGTIPLVLQARSFNHGVFLGSIVGSEITAAALDLKAGSVRRDPFAMLPFCGYHMGDYLRHWIGIGRRSDTAGLPKFFLVNWFRRGADGKFLWPGYGENGRVLAWIFDQCEGATGQAVETPIGILPTPEAITRPDGVSEADMRELLAVDLPGWQKELDDVRSNHYPIFKDRLSAELAAELSSLESRLQ
jgi:phosphoenolpyruvate carboxykinase (GTP)